MAPRAALVSEKHENAIRRAASRHNRQRAVPLGEESTGNEWIELLVLDVVKAATATQNALETFALTPIERQVARFVCRHQVSILAAPTKSVGLSQVSCFLG